MQLPLDYSGIETRYKALLERIESLRKTWQIPYPIHLIAVSKNQPVQAIHFLYQLGQRDFGENRVQELLSKAKELPHDIQWHLIGHLQSNKVKPATQYATLIHSIDSLHLIERLERIAQELGKKQEILIQVKLTNEITKTGASPQEVPHLVEKALNCPHLILKGFMTMSALGASSEECENTFRQLKTLRDQEAQRHHYSFPILSMGMSDDYEYAIKNGATHLRIGTAIFGARN